MSFHLTRDRRPSRQLPDLLADELECAVKLLAADPPDADAIHEARKCVKKARALLRLVRQGLGNHYEAEERRLAVVAHSLSALRDADASMETLDQLRRDFPAVLKPATAHAIAKGLSGRKRDTRAGAVSALSQAREALKTSLRSAPARIGAAGGLAAVKIGVARGYRRARKAFGKLEMESGVAEFHRWRRRVKDHWYHLRLMEQLHAAPRLRARSLEELEQLLGDDHNLALLRGLILAAPQEYGSARETTLVLGSIAWKQHGLRRAALTLGKQLFEERAGKFRREVADWWK